MFATHPTTTRPMGIARANIPLARARNAWMAAFAKWRRRRKAIADLHALSNRSLADIGIDRAEIEAIVHAGGRDVSRRAR